MAEFETDYQALGTFDDEHEAPPGENIVHVVPDNGKGKCSNLLLYVAKKYLFNIFINDLPT